MDRKRGSWRTLELSLLRRLWWNSRMTDRVACMLRWKGLISCSFQLREVPVLRRVLRRLVEDWLHLRKRKKVNSLEYPNFLSLV